MADYVIGIDLGGTFIKAGVVDKQGKSLARTSVETEVKKGHETVVTNICRAADIVRDEAGLSWHDIIGIGIGAPGTLDIKNGVVLLSPNLPCLNEMPLRQLVAEKVPVPVVLENDANAAAWGEKWVGAGRGVNSLVMFTLGTGIGGGIILDNRIWHGANDVAAEIGHMSVFAYGVKCACGNLGCIEAYASATGMIRRMKEAIQEGKPSLLAEKVKNGEEFLAKDIHDAALQGDKTAEEIIVETGRLLGVAATNMMHILNPDMIVFSGGMINAGDMLLHPIKEEVNKRAFPASREKCQIVFAELGGDAGFIGAAGCALTEFETSA